MLSKHYLKKVESRTDKFDVLLPALTRFDERYIAGDPNFAKSIERAGALRGYKAYVPTEQLISMVLSVLPERFPNRERFTQLSFDDIKMFETMFGGKFVQAFTFSELAELDL